MNKFLEKSVAHIDDISSCVEDISPALATFYRLQQVEMRYKGEKNSSEDHCPFCNKPYKPDSCRTRLKSKSKLTPRIQKLLNRYSVKPESLGKFQRKLVKDYIEGKSVVVTTCLTCKKTVKKNGESRLEREQEQLKLQKRNEEKTAKPVKPPSAEEKKKGKKKEKKKLLKKRRKEGINCDLNAGLILPEIPVSVDTSEASERLAADKETEPQTSSTTDEAYRPTNDMEAKIYTSLKSERKELKTEKTKPKLTDLNKLLKEENSKKIEGISVSLQQTKAMKKKKQLGQKLGLILKQEKTKSSGGSLSDFLSSL